MTDSRGKTDTTASNRTSNYNEGIRDREEDANIHITSLGHSSNVVNIGVSVNATDFAGDVYINGGKKRLSIDTVKRYRRLMKQRAIQASSITDTERETRREEHNQDWQERRRKQREENERRWEERNKREGKILSKQEHKVRDEEKRKSQEGKSKTRRLTSFFQPVVKGSQTVELNASEAVETATNISPRNVDGEDEAVEENSNDQESTFKQGMKVYLRLAFRDEGTSQFQSGATCKKKYQKERYYRKGVHRRDGGANYR